MKSIIVCIFLLLGSFSYGQNLSGEITYKKILDFDKGSKNDEKIGEMVTGVSKSVKGIDYTLLFNDKESFFALNEVVLNDANRYQSRAISYGGGRGKYYHNLESKKILDQVKFFGKLFIVQIPVSKYKWEITNETKEIGNYITRKAVATVIFEAPLPHLKDKIVKIEAWFAPEIPLAYGPTEYAGLPGLILESSRGHVTYRATRLQLNKNSQKKVEIEKPSEGELIKEEELSERLNKMRKSLRNR